MTGRGLGNIAEAGLLRTVLLIFIFAKLHGTISTTVREREVAAEPLLLIGLEAVVRHILAVRFTIEQFLGNATFQDLLLELRC